MSVYPILRMTKKIKVSMTSATEAEFVALCHETMQAFRMINAVRVFLPGGCETGATLPLK